MSDEIPHPTEYNEFVALIESNDTAVVAQILAESYTPNEELRALIERWQERLEDVYHNDPAMAGSIGRQLDELEAAIDDNTTTEDHNE